MQCIVIIYIIACFVCNNAFFTVSYPIECIEMSVAAVKDKIMKSFSNIKKINENVLRRLEIKTIVNNKSNTSPFSSLPLLYT